MLRLSRRLRRLDPILFVLGCGSLLAVGGLAFMLAGPQADSREPQTKPAVAAPMARAEPPRPAKISERTEAAIVQEQRLLAGDDLSAERPFTLEPPLRSVDGTSFRRGEDLVRLHGVQGPGPEAVCAGAAGEGRWACGLQARAALHNLVAGRSLSCQPRKALAAGMVSAQCVLPASERQPAGDVARQLVLQGWARPIAGADDPLGEAAAKAKAAGAGLWRGDWTIVGAER